MRPAVRTETLWMAEQTCDGTGFCEIQPNGTGWMVSGCGLTPTGGLWGLDEWRTAMKARSRPSAGHWCAVELEPDRVHLDTDPLGVRSVYASRLHACWVFGSDLTMVAQITARGALNPTAFGSHWLLQNQLGRDSLIQGIERFSGECATVHPGGKLEHGPAFAPNRPVQDAPKTFVTALRSFLEPAHEAASLGLSGGLDSRLLLSLSNEHLQLHTFGPSTRPDVRTAMRVATAAGRPISQLSTEPKDIGELVRDTAVQNLASTPASAAADLNQPREVARRGLVMLDGGFGEIGRRVFMGRLERSLGTQGTSVPSRPSAALLLRYLRFSRGNFFEPSLAEDLLEGAEVAVEEAGMRFDISNLPDWADRTGVDSRLPNFFGYEQARLDRIGPAYMPFAQPAVISSLLALPLSERTHSRAYKRSIRSQTPPLSRIPLVKGGHTYPFGWPPLPAYALVRIKAQFHSGVSERDRFLARHKDFLLGHISDASACEWYDHGRLQAAAAAYFKGDRREGAALDWWLSLELFRRGLSGGS